MNLQIVYTWKRKWNRQVVQEVTGACDEPKGHDRNPLLSEEHKVFLKVVVLLDPTVTLDQLLNKPSSAFEGVKVSDSTIHNFPHQNLQVQSRETL